MTRTKYREERTLVRSINRLPKQDKAEFKKNVLRLRRYFEQYNLDVSETCQWLISYRGLNLDEICKTQLFWEFMLEPERFCARNDPGDPRGDWIRHAVFEVVAGWKLSDNLDQYNLNEELTASIEAAMDKTRTATAEALFERLMRREASNVMVLLKVAAEWIAAKYVHQMENWKRQKEEWEKEKAEWENSHTELTEQVRDKYNRIFKELDIKNKRPRVCTWKRLSENKDNCDWAGKRKLIGKSWVNHAALCYKYHEYSEAPKVKHRDHFIANANKYIKIRREYPQWSRDQAMKTLFKNEPRASYWFPKEWKMYLGALGIEENTIIGNYTGCLPHCLKITHKCRFNKHTNECRRYKDLMHERLTNEERQLEELYREWRRNYLIAPGKPALRYPSARTLPTPKIFGSGYYRLDFERNQVHLRLDDMSQGDFISFGIKAWPRKYDYQPDTIDITSVQVHFVGTRARIGFRFKVPHRESIFTIRQDDIDELRSRKYPRESQDQKFLEEVRKRILNGFSEDQIAKLKIMAVDLGSDEGGVAFFKGHVFEKGESLKIIKIDELFESKKNEEAEKAKGLNVHHVGRHLDVLQKKSQEIALLRQGMTNAPSNDMVQSLYPNDMRRLTSHIRRMIRDWVRLNSSQIIKLAEREQVELIVFESMRGFLAPGYDKIDPDKKRRLAFFAFGSIRRKVAEKAVERGMRVVTVPYHCSSQVCAKCGKEQEDKKRFRKNKEKREFVCEDKKCNHKTNSDINAAHVCGRVFWGEINLLGKKIKIK